MNRHVKFRGKSTETGQFVYGFLSQVFTKSSNYQLLGPVIIFYLPNVGMRSEEVEPGTIGQYTGLNDMLNAEVYEGDIISGSIFRNAVVVWNEKICAFQYAYHAVGKGTAIGGRMTNTLYEHEIKEKFEVVGNMYDNAELLKK